MVGGIDLDAFAQVIVLEHVDADILCAQMIEHLHDERGEAATRLVGRALHEQDNVVPLDGGVDEGIDV